MMDRNETSGAELKDLAEQAMADKRDQVGNEAQVHELWDVPTESAETLAEQQAEEDAQSSAGNSEGVRG